MTSGGLASCTMTCSDGAAYGPKADKTACEEKCKVADHKEALTYNWTDGKCYCSSDKFGSNATSDNTTTCTACTTNSV